MAHTTNGHGFVIMDFKGENAVADAEAAAMTIGGAKTSAPAKIGSVDLMEDPNGTANNGERPQGTRVIIEVSTNPDPIKSEAAHQTLLQVETWANGLVGNPGLGNHFCCFSDH